MSQFTQNIRRLFFRLSVREQVLIFAILTVLVLWWLSAELGDWRSHWTRYNSHKFQLQEQQIWIDDKERIEQDLEAALQELESDKTYSASELAGRVDDIAIEKELNHSISNQRTSPNEDFNIHSIRISVRRADLRSVIDFCNALQAEAPYLVIESMDISANRSRPTEHDAKFVISSFELKNIAL
ncbi:MAG: hypothetical protein ACPGN3_00385 [Opitutales bacterium]